MRKRTYFASRRQEMANACRYRALLSGPSVYAAAIPASSTEADNARAFIAALTGPEMSKRWTDAGFEQAGQ
jgi:ABC-type molybdate transport system substrate-binding protein